MRPKERIDNFLKLINWDKLWIRWDYVDFDTTLRCKTLEDIVKYWKENPEQRIGQIMINLGVLPDKYDIWSDEESSILLDQGIAPEDCLYWTSIYDKEDNLLEEPITRLIKNLEPSHIKRILKMCYKNLSDEYKQAFENVLNKHGITTYDIE